MKKDIVGSNMYCLVGEIGYGCVDEGAQPGKLIILKPVLNGTEPPDILAYHASHPDFPHESTSNQFFNESQFESYRHLGSWIVHSVTESTPASVDQSVEMSGFVARVTSYRQGGESVSTSLTERQHRGAVKWGTT